MCYGCSPKILWSFLLPLRNFPGDTCLTCFHSELSPFPPLPFSITKAAITLGLVFAYCHTPGTTAVDYTHLLVLGGIFLSSVKIWTVLSRNIDPFSKPQQLIWGLLTSLAFPPSPSTNFGIGGNGYGNGGNGKNKKQVRFSSDVKTDTHLKEE